ncbi:MAG: 3-keto-disaccharide hydrolase [Pirellulaceae bacterium]
MRSLLFTLVFFLAAVASSPASAQPKKPVPGAVFDDAHADEDFSVQGEYFGELSPPGNPWMQVGLQVVSLGGGKFDGVLYRGGLPGAGWDGSRVQKTSGERAGSRLSLQGPTHHVLLAGDQAAVYTADGKKAGILSKTRRESPTMGAPPPPEAVVLFAGSGTDRFTGGKLAADGTLPAGVLTKMPVHDFHMHLEFRTPYMPQARGQGRGNSGVYIQQRYEVQILDSFGLDGANNECGGLYKQAAPSVNMCLPPLAWQTYDIWFTAARFAVDGTTKVANARITVLHNGVPIHSQREITARTGGGKTEGPEDFPINLQDHGNPVTFRNIWLMNGAATSTVEAVPLPCPAPRRVGWRHRFR